MISTPFLTVADPPASSEGTLDPLGLYQVADQLATELVPAVRERMTRIRFLSTIAVGTILVEGLEEDPAHRDAPPCLVWEWHVVEALMRSNADDPTVWGVPGSIVTRKAVNQHGYLDARSYLKTARIFGFHGVYKRLAMHLGIVSPRLGIAPYTEILATAWAHGQGFGSLREAQPLLTKWRDAVRRGLAGNPPRTRPGWNADDWHELATAFAPSAAKARERHCIHDLLHGATDHPLGALPAMWRLQDRFTDDDYHEESLHRNLGAEAPAYRPLLAAIVAYERFARSLEDAFDVLRAEAGRHEEGGYRVPSITSDNGFRSCVRGLHERYAAAFQALGELSGPAATLQNAFAERFLAFASPREPADVALALCEHHEEVQRRKPPNGKRSWFERLAPDRIYLRHSYRIPAGDLLPDRYVHGYRGAPVRRFYKDLTRG